MAPRRRPQQDANASPQLRRSSPRLRADVAAAWEVSRERSAARTAEANIPTPRPEDGPEDDLAPGPQPPLAAIRQPPADAVDGVDDDVVIEGMAVDPNPHVIEEMAVDPNPNVSRQSQGFLTATSRRSSVASHRTSQSSGERQIARRVNDVAPTLPRTARQSATFGQRDRDQWTEDARQQILCDMDALLSAKLADLLGSHSQTAPARPPTLHSAKEHDMRGEGPSFTRRDKIIDVDTLLHRDRTSHNYTVPRPKPKLQVRAPETSDDETELPSIASHSRRRAPTWVMAAPEQQTRQGRWIIPRDIPQLTEDVDDVDWWFHMMQIHLNKCRITDRQERVDCLHTHTEDAFHQRIWQRCDAEAVNRSLMYRDEDTYRVFVADRFTKATALQQLQRKLDMLAGKSLTPTKAWDEVYRLSFCFNEKAKRRERPLLTQEDITRHFISALPSKIKDCMRSLMLHDHPMVYDASHALTVASRYLEEQALESGGKDTTEMFTDGPEDDQTAMFAARGRGGRKRGRRQETADRGAKRHHPNSGRTEQQHGNVDASRAMPALAALPAQEPKSVETRICYRCKQRGHLRKDCRAQLPVSQQADAQTSTRHIAYQQRQTAGRDRPICSECGRVGHSAEQCWIAHPELRPQGGRQRAANRREARERQGQGTAANATPVVAPRSRMVGLAASAAAAQPQSQPARNGTDTSWLHPAEDADSGSAAYLALSTFLSKQPQQSPQRPPPTASTLLAISALLATPTTPVTSQPLVPDPCRCLLFLHTVYRGRTLRLVIDTGASVNLVNAAVLDQAHSRYQVAPFEIKGVNGQRQTLTMQVEMAMDLSGYPYAFSLYVADNLPICAILGLDAIIEAGWLVDAIYRQLLHVHHALPPLKLAPCTHTVLLVRTNAEVTIPARTWKHVTVTQPYQRPDVPQFVCACLTPSLPPTKTIHGAPIIADWTSDTLPIPLCNTGGKQS